ncbi:hypothetical protein ACOSP7_012687 [Xanthoceras sorbifolium]|uniref:Uncharacterized protein n=1 Tax=Xanthoceras sorbifolium TaxID=99658 RepID=A0ABQ8HY80_9ROSI|nr:hypothetical protein JRO89_XS06G0142900 [Xanthoceras sorbifolium]
MLSSSQSVNGYGALLFSSPHPFHHYRSATIYRRGLRRDQGCRVASRSNSQAFQVVATSNVSPKDRNSSKEVIMVDPLEAKRLAAKQLQEIKAKEKFKRRRQIEAINGAWAMIGLTVGLVIEGQTGKNILAQLADYLSAVVNFFMR